MKNWLIRLVEWYFDRLDLQQAEREEEERRRMRRELRLKQNALVQAPRPSPALCVKKTAPDVDKIQSEGLDRLFDSLAYAPEQNGHSKRQTNLPVNAGYVQVHYKVYQGANKWRDESAWLTESGEIVAQVSAPPLLIAHSAAETALEKSGGRAVMTAPQPVGRRKWARHWQVRRRH